MAQLTARTVRTCLRHRVTGLAAEIGFFALLSLPPLVLGLVASLGFLGGRPGSPGLDRLRWQVEEVAGGFLTSQTVQSLIVPTFEEVLRAGHPEIVSVGFLLSLWSGSRALNVCVDTVTIMYGLGGRRGIVRTRVLSFSLYVCALALGVVLIPLAVLGPGVVGELVAGVLPVLPRSFWLAALYWPAVVLLCVSGLTTLYHLATPVRGPWRRDLPGAVLALVIWVAASTAVRVGLAASVGGESIYGPLSAPIVLLIWLYVLAIAVLIGAALNAAVADLGASVRGLVRPRH